MTCEFKPFLPAKDEDAKHAIGQQQPMRVTLVSDIKHPPMTNSEINQAFPPKKTCVHAPQGTKLSLLLKQRVQERQLVAINTSSLHKEEMSPCMEFSSAHFCTGSGSGTTTATRLD